MKVMLIKGQIINLEEIRNVYAQIHYTSHEVVICFRNSTHEHNQTILSAANQTEAREIIEEIYEKMLDKS